MFIVMVYKYHRYTLLEFTFPYSVQRHTLYAVHYTVMTIEIDRTIPRCFSRTTIKLFFNYTY